VIATRKLAASGWIKPEETVVLSIPGTGYKYAEAWQRALQPAGGGGLLDHAQALLRRRVRNGIHRTRSKVCEPGFGSFLTSGQSATWEVVLDQTAFIPLPEASRTTSASWVKPTSSMSGC